MAAITDALATRLQSLAASNRHFAFIIRHLGQKRRRTPVSDLDRVRYDIVHGGYQISMDETLDVFEELQRLGVGKLHKQRRPGHSTFEWKYVMQDVAEVALAGDPRKAKLPMDRTSVTTSVKPHQTHTIALYATIRGRIVSLQLPPDFSRADAAELSSYLEQLAASRNA